MKESAVDRAYTWVRQAILDGTLPGGSFIDEATACAAAGVSRTPAREAFNRLEGERFITLVPRRGAQVREFNATDLAEAHQSRFMTESFAVAQFCASKSPVPPLMYHNLAIMDEHADYNSIEDFTRYEQADEAFHGALVATLGNSAIQNFYETLWRWNQFSIATRSSKLIRSDAWLAANRHQHHAILAGLAAHDASAVIDTLREHLSVSDFSTFDGFAI